MVYWLLQAMTLILSALCIQSAPAQTTSDRQAVEPIYSEAPKLEVLKVLADIGDQQAVTAVTFQFHNQTRRANKVEVAFRLSKDKSISQLSLNNPQGGFFETQPVDDAGRQFARVFGASGEEYAVVQQQDGSDYLLVAGSQASQRQQTVVVHIHERLSRDEKGRFVYRVPLDLRDTPAGSVFALVEFHGKTPKKFRLHGDLTRGVLSINGKHSVAYFEAQDYRMREPAEISWLGR